MLMGREWIEDYGGFEIYKVRGGFIAENLDGYCIEDLSIRLVKMRIDGWNRRRDLL